MGMLIILAANAKDLNKLICGDCLDRCVALHQGSTLSQEIEGDRLGGKRPQISLESHR